MYVPFSRAINLANKKFARIKFAILLCFMGKALFIDKKLFYNS